MVHKITVEHSFESGHGLSHLGGKCVSLHGHSWSTAVTMVAPKLSPEVTVVEFSALKVGLRRWIDEHLDHAMMLSARDRLIEPLIAEGSRVFCFGAERPADVAEQFAHGLPWPTVEAITVLRGRVAESVSAGLPRAGGASRADSGPRDAAQHRRLRAVDLGGPAFRRECFLLLPIDGSVPRLDASTGRASRPPDAQGSARSRTVGRAAAWSDSFATRSPPAAPDRPGQPPLLARDNHSESLDVVPDREARRGGGYGDVTGWECSCHSWERARHKVGGTTMSPEWWILMIMTRNSRRWIAMEL
ncbi:hypothetical protein ALI144C_52720 [Actinosynnema sp. ALI-1.44]|nr:hypothetical protein ALI144C_52720 [Actinosynnema sp. ALI-1.44]